MSPQASSSISASSSTPLFPEGAALIVGGSGGIGSYVAREFANAGSNVALTYRTKKDVAEKLARELGGEGRKVTAHGLTIGDPAQVEAVLQEAIKAHGRIHTVVYACATLTHQVYISEITSEQWKEAVEQDLNGFFNIVHATLPHFRAAGGGSYVNLGSAGDLRWPDRDGLSVIPKAAIEALIKGLAKEEGKYGVRANTVLVGVIEAGMFLELT